jgi:GTP cyclohydrolase IA
MDHDTRRGVFTPFARDGLNALLRSIGEDPGRGGLAETPDRFIRAFQEMTAGYQVDVPALFKTFDDTSDEMVIVRGIEFWSLCEHHLLPFHGTMTIGYIPADGRVVGLSKLARVGLAFARRLQVQERLTNEVSGAIEEHLRPRGVGVLVRASHLCMAARGVRAPAEMVTSSLLGAMRDPAPRAEFLDLARPA